MPGAEEIYTHGHAESVLRSHRARTVDNSAAYVAHRLVPGTDVLDIGCGPATITVDIAARVAPGTVLGIDAATDALRSAADVVEGSGSANVTVRQGDVYALDVPDDSFDVVHAHQVLQHLADPVAALREMRRVCRPGGAVAVRDGVYRAMTWYPASEGISRWLDVYCAVAEANGGEPDAGSHLHAWTRAAGFREVAASASAWCFSTDDERAWWGGLWADRIEATALGTRAVELGVAAPGEPAAMAAAWREWAAAPDGWFAVLHGEVLATP